MPTDYFERQKCSELLHKGLITKTYYIRPIDDPSFTPPQGGIYGDIIPGTITYEIDQTKLGFLKKLLIQRNDLAKKAFWLGLNRWNPDSGLVTETISTKDGLALGSLHYSSQEPSDEEKARLNGLLEIQQARMTQTTAWKDCVNAEKELNEKIQEIEGAFNYSNLVSYEILDRPFGLGEPKRPWFYLEYFIANLSIWREVLELEMEYCNLNAHFKSGPISKDELYFPAIEIYLQKLDQIKARLIRENENKNTLTRLEPDDIQSESSPLAKNETVNDPRFTGSGDYFKKNFDAFLEAYKTNRSAKNRYTVHFMDPQNPQAETSLKSVVIINRVSFPNPPQIPENL